MNKIRRSAIIALKKWISLKTWKEMHDSDCNFCDDALVKHTENEGHALAPFCNYCIAPKILCGRGMDSLYQMTMSLHEVTDDFNPKKSIRLMRVGILFLFILGKLPGRLVKYIKKYIMEMNIMRLIFKWLIY